MKVETTQVNPQLLANRLAALMAERQMKQYELAAMIDVSPSYVSYLLGGRLVSPGVDYLRRVAKFFDVPLDYLTGATDDRRPYMDRMSEAMISPAEQVLVEQHRQLSPALQEHLLEMARSLVRASRDHPEPAPDAQSPRPAKAARPELRDRRGS